MALTDSQRPPRASAFRVPARLQAWLASERGAIQRMAGGAFAIRVTGAITIFLSQILLARWMGSAEFGIYVYAWTWLQMVGDIIHLGLPLTAQRTIPEYTQSRQARAAAMKRTTRRRHGPAEPRTNSPPRQRYF